MVPCLGGVVEQCAVGLLDDLFERHAFEFCTADQFVDIRDVCLMMLSVVELHRLLAYLGGEVTQLVRELRQ